MCAWRPIQRKATFAVMLALMALASTSVSRPAAAEGALAVGQPADVAAEGYAYGFGINLAGDAASAKAMRDCSTASPGVDPRAQRLCTIVQTFRNKCFAVALDPKDATPGAGWAVADDKATAGRNALAKCMETAGDDRRSFCTVTHTDCDGEAK
ncbi:MAG TPA: DUF4189 domain-containing protein [Xanthobacteraceae bacterium]|jgi:hypothetical protein